MAISKHNLLLDQFSGRIGNIIVKNYSYGAVISKSPDMSKVIKTPKQLAASLKFKAAQAFAKSVISSEEKRKEFEKLRKPGQQVYHAAIAHYMKTTDDQLLEPDEL